MYKSPFQYEGGWTAERLLQAFRYFFFGSSVAGFAAGAEGILKTESSIGTLASILSMVSFCRFCGLRLGPLSV